MKKECILSNARIFYPHAAITGSVFVDDGVITHIEEKEITSHSKKTDLQGNFLLPGLIELHTYHLETHLQPRPGVLWPS